MKWMNAVQRARFLVGVVAIVFVATPGGSAWAKAPKGRARALYKEGVALGNKGKIAEAIGKFRAALAADPKFFPAALDLGTAYRLRKRYPEAAAAFRRALTINDKSLKAHEGLARTYYALKAYDLAAAEFDTVLRDKKRQKDADLWERLGRARLGAEQVAQAIAAFNQALRVKADHVGATVGLGEAYFKKGDVDKAVKLFRNATRLDPKRGGAWMGLGYALQRLGKKNEAHDAFKKACDLGRKKACHLANLL